MRAHHKHYTPPPPPDDDLFSMTDNERGELIGWCPDCGKPADHRHMPGLVELFREVIPPAQPVDTSLAAAAKIQGHTARLREAVYQFIRVTGGATAGEIATGCGLNPSTVRPRLLELEGRASWAKGKLPARIRRTSEKRDGMRVYQIVNQ